MQSEPSVTKESFIADLGKIAAESNDPVVKSFSEQMAALIKLEEWQDEPTDIDSSFSFQELLLETDRGCLLSATAFLTPSWRNGFVTDLLNLGSQARKTWNSSWSPTSRSAHSAQG